MGSTCPTNEKGIKRKVVVRSWIARDKESERERERVRNRDRVYIDAFDGVWEICEEQ